MDKKIFITRPLLPPLEEFLPYLQNIWETGILTNNGPFHQELEKALSEYLGVKFISLFANGTLALITALKALNLRGEVITTPFSFVATSHALLWNGLKPVFADIEPQTWTLDPRKVEAAITTETSAILPVHVYGYPCRVNELKEIAKGHNLLLIYDAAQTFGSRIAGESLCSFGDISILSFHATKVFNTFEGGAVICHDPLMKERIDQLKNFGITSETSVMETGINSKMNEFQAAMGILQLKYVDVAIAKRKFVSDQYSILLKEVAGIAVLNEIPGTEYNFAYFPVLIDAVKFGKSRDEVYNELRKNNIYCRRYYYPLISRFPMYNNLKSASPGNLILATTVAEEVLCLPIYPDLEPSKIEEIVEIIHTYASL